MSTKVFLTAGILILFCALPLHAEQNSQNSGADEAMDSAFGMGAETQKISEEVSRLLGLPFSAAEARAIEVQQLDDIEEQVRDILSLAVSDDRRGPAQSPMPDPQPGILDATVGTANLQTTVSEASAHSESRWEKRWDRETGSQEGERGHS